MCGDIGISTFGSKPDQVGDHLQGLLDFAQEVVPMHLQPSTPVFLMATAGMRLLPLDEQQVLMEKTCHYIKENSGFFTSDCGTHIRTIPGELEGVYGWVAVNYLMGGFDRQQQQQQQQQHTFGFLDMGGASAQIAFEPDHHQKEEHGSDLTKIHLRTLDGSAVDYDVFVTTFLGYGSNEARRRYLEQRVKAAFDEHQQQQQQEENDGTTTSSLLDEYHRLHLDDPCLPLHLELTDADTTSVPLQLTGTGQFDQCLEATLPLLNKDAECPTQPCLFNGVHTPKIDWSVHQFVGISEYWYTSHDVLGLGGVYDFNQYEEKATAFCGKDWGLELEDHPDWDATEIQRYQLQCFKSAWMVNVLHGGIEVPRIVDEQQAHSTSMTAATTQWMEQSIESVEHKNWNPPFRSIDTINDIQVSWTLGAMLIHVANQIPLSENGINGHSSEDEQPHPIVDGVELPSADSHHEPTLPTAGMTWPSAPEDDTVASWWDLGNTVSVVGLLAMLMVLFGVVLWEWYRYAKKHKRGGEYRRVDTNGGILGNVSSSSSLSPSITNTTSSPSSSWSEFLAGPIMVMKQVTVRPMIVLRYWTSRLVSYCSNPNGDGPIVDDGTYHVGMSGNNTELEHLDQQDAVSITMYQQQAQQQQHSHLHSHQQYPPLAPSSSQAYLLQNSSSATTTSTPSSSSPPAPSSSMSNNGSLGPSTKSASMISMKYWQKKRYSGDSHHIAQMIQPGNSRSNSSSSLAGFTASNSPMSRSRSRIGFAIHETSDEDDYLTPTASVSDITRTPSPSIKRTIIAASSSAAPSPKQSPRSSLEFRRKDDLV